MPRLFDSCQSYPNSNLISDKMHLDKHITDLPRRFDNFASFDEECQRVQRNVHIRKYDGIEKISMQPSHMKARSFDDCRNFVCNEEESKSSSDQLKVMTSTKEFMGILEEPNPLRARRIRNVCRPATDEVTIQSVLAAKFLGHDSSPGDAVASHKGKANRSGDRVVILKPVQQNNKYPEQVTCHCSSMPSNTLSRRVSDMKLTPFSFGEMKRKLKHTFRGTKKGSGLPRSSSAAKTVDCYSSRGYSIIDSCDSSIGAIIEGNSSKQKVLKLKQGSHASSLSRAVDRNVNFSGLSKTNQFDVMLEAKRHLSLRLRDLQAEETSQGKNSPKTLRRILSSPERPFWRLSPIKGSQYCSSSSSQMRYGPCKANDTISKENSGEEMAIPGALGPYTKVASCYDCNNCDGANKTPMVNSRVRKNDEMVRGTDASVGENIVPQDDCDIVNLQPEFRIFETPSSRNSRNTRIMQITGTIELEKDQEGPMRSILDSLLGNEESSSTIDHIPSTPFGNHQSDILDGVQHQKEYRSPVSVLEPFFMDDGNSPSSISSEKADVRLQPLCLSFEECSSESSPKDQPVIANLYTEEHDHLSHYVHSVLQASCLNWDKLSEVNSLPEELVQDSLFDGVAYLRDECYFDPKLLFDHINEVLLEIHKSHFGSPPQPAFLKPKTMSSPLAEAVINEIMKEADFYLLPQTEKRTLDQLVLKDVAKCISWLDLRQDAGMIVNDVSEDVLDDSVLDILLDFLI